MILKILIIPSAHMSMCGHTVQHFRSLLPSFLPYLLTFIISFIQRKPRHLMDESFVLNTHLNMCIALKGVTNLAKMVLLCLKMNSICLIFSHWRSYVLYPRRTEDRGKEKYYILTTVLFTLFIKPCSSVAFLNVSSVAEI